MREKKKKIIKGMPQSLTYRFGLCGCDMDKICIEKKKKKITCHLYI